MMRDKLIAVQSKLNAPKSQYNSFGKYSYRSCEDILEAVKPLLDNQGLYLTVSDEIVLIGDRYYVRATATVSDGTEKISTTAYARERAEKKGMDESQITGSASSYARKYALNGLFCIDDSKDRDALNTGENGFKQAQKAKLTNNTHDIERAANDPVQPPQRAAPAATRNWDEISREPQWQNAKCVNCGNPVDPMTAAKSFYRYGNVFCSKACMTGFEERKAARAAQI